MIDPTIHFVWVNNKNTKQCPLPDYAVPNMRAWQELNPNYKVHYWNNDNRPALEPIQEIAFSNARNAGEAADVLRYNLVHMLGGWSIDLDIAPVKPLDELRKDFDVFRMINSHMEASAVVLDNGSRVFAGNVGNSFFTELLRTLPELVSNSVEHYPNLRVAFTGFNHIQNCVAKGIGISHLLTLPGNYFPTKDKEDCSQAFGIHDFAGEWVKQIL